MVVVSQYDWTSDLKTARQLFHKYQYIDEDLTNINLEKYCRWCIDRVIGIDVHRLSFVAERMMWQLKGCDTAHVRIPLSESTTNLLVEPLSLLCELLNKQLTSILGHLDLQQTTSNEIDDLSEAFLAFGGREKISMKELSELLESNFGVVLSSDKEAVCKIEFPKAVNGIKESLEAATYQKMSISGSIGWRNRSKIKTLRAAPKKNNLLLNLNSNELKTILGSKGRGQESQRMNASEDVYEILEYDGQIEKLTMVLNVVNQDTIKQRSDDILKNIRKAEAHKRDLRCNNWKRALTEKWSARQQLTHKYKKGFKGKIDVEAILASRLHSSSKPLSSQSEVRHRQKKQRKKPTKTTETVTLSRTTSDSVMDNWTSTGISASHQSLPFRKEFKALYSLASKPPELFEILNKPSQPSCSMPLSTL